MVLRVISYMVYLKFRRGDWLIDDDLGVIQYLYPVFPCMAHQATCLHSDLQAAVGKDFHPQIRNQV